MSPDPVTHYRKRKDASGAAGSPVGGPLCGDRQEGDGLAKAWAGVDCQRCLDLRHAPPPPPEPEPEPAAAWKTPDQVPPILVQLCAQAPLLACARLGKLPPVEAIDAWAAQTAVVLDHYLGGLPDHPLVAWVVTSAALAYAIHQAPPVQPPEPAP